MAEFVLTADTKLTNCVVCGEEILDNGLPLCVDCIDPENAIVYCQHCKTHFELQDNEADNKWWQLFESLPEFPGYERKGTTIKVSHCPDCMQKHDLGKDMLRVNFFHVNKKKDPDTASS